MAERRGPKARTAIVENTKTRAYDQLALAKPCDCDDCKRLLKRIG